MGGPVIGVVGGSGGVGSSSFAGLLGLVAGARAGRSVLVDLDVAGGGVDVLLGIDEEAGARWSGLALAGGHLDPWVLLDGLPRAGPCAVLAADTAGIEAEAAQQVLEAAATAGPVVIDLPRGACPARAVAVAACDLVVVVGRADAAGLVAAHAMVSALGEAPLGLVVRRADIDPAEAAHLVGLSMLGVLPAPGTMRRAIESRRPPRALARLAVGVLTGATSSTRRPGRGPAAVTGPIAVGS